VPAIASSLLEEVWVEFDALLSERPQFHPDHPLRLSPALYSGIVIGLVFRKTIPLGPLVSRRRRIGSHGGLTRRQANYQGTHHGTCRTRATWCTSDRRQVSSSPTATAQLMWFVGSGSSCQRRRSVGGPGRLRCDCRCPDGTAGRGVVVGPFRSTRFQYCLVGVSKCRPGLGSDHRVVGRELS
jgi:hypothetical protein